MFHNLPYGADLPKDAIKAADKMNLRIIAPFSPSYGDSDSLQNIGGEKLLG